MAHYDGFVEAETNNLINRLRSEKAALERRITQLETLCRQYRSLIDTHEELKRDLQAQLAALTADRDNLLIQVDELQRQLGEDE